MDNKHWRVLIIDDSPDDRAEFQWALLNGSERRYSFEEAETGYQGLRLLREAAIGTYDCVLLDYHLPDMEAPEILAELSAANKSFPVVVLTGVTTPKLGHEVICAGAQDLMGKGWINPESLTRTIGNAVERHKLVSERDLMERALRSSETRLRSIFEASGDAIGLLGPEGFRECNKATLRLFGCESEHQFLGKQPRDFSPIFQPNGLTTEVMSAENLALVQIKGSHRFEWRHCRLDGSEFDADILLTRLDLPEGQVMQAILRDITERKSIERQLQESESRFRVLFESSGNAIALIDENGYFECNAACFSLFGCVDKQQFLGKTPTYFSPPHQPDGGDSRVMAAEHIANTYQSGKTSFEWRHRRINGTEFDADIALVLIELDGRQVIHATVRDITHRKQMSLELAAAKDEADRANQAKSMFLANMSHEIRTPISAVIGLTKLCLGERSFEKIYAYLLKIEKASETLLQLINDILDFSKIEAEKFDLSEEPFQLRGVFENLASVLETKANEKGLELVLPASAVPANVFVGDAQRLLQVLINLVSNGIKFTSAGHVEVGVVMESKSEGKAVLRFSVRDQGIGIAPETLAGLFQPFVQADNSTSRIYGGTGLGLALSKRLVEMMGGCIWAESQVGSGTCFYFTVCYGIGDQLQFAASSHRQQSLDDSKRALLRDRHILVAEDSEFNQVVIVELLKQAGFRVRLVKNGEEAISALENDRPDAVLMDCQMPVMDGYEATRQLRLQECYQNLPIIALTANALQGDREKCLKAGMNDFLTKPVQMEQLMLVLARWIGLGQEFSTAAISDSARADVELPGINTTQGLQYMGGQWPIYLKFLKMFRDMKLLAFKAEYSDATDRRDWGELVRLPHNLKSEARALGALELGDLADALEQAAKTQETATIETALAPLLREVALIQSGLNQLD